MTRAAALIVLLVAAVAHADDKKVAAAHFRAGSSLYERGDYPGALVEFEAGFAIFPMPAFHINIAQCHRKLEQFDEAALEYTRFLDTSTGDPALREEVREALAEARQLSAEHAAMKRPPVAHEVPAPVVVAPALAAPAPVLRPAPAPLFAATPPPPPAAPKKKSRWWVWTIVTVAAAGAVAASVAVAYVETQPTGPRAGSLGLLDGRR